MTCKTGIHWFRHGLRIHDNPALCACLEEVQRFIPIFIFDNKSAGTEICGYIRFKFLLEALEDLESQFASYGIHFMCFYGEPHEVLEKLIKDWGVKIISFEKDSEAIWRERDDLVKEMCERKRVQVIECVSHTLYDSVEIFNLNKDNPPNTCQELRRFCQTLGEPPKPTLMPDLLFISEHLKTTSNLYDAKRHKVPTIQAFGIEPECVEQTTSRFVGGETRALQLLASRLKYENKCFQEGYINPNFNKPVLFTVEVSLSPYLRFGCISVRTLYWRLKLLYDKENTSTTQDLPVEFHPAQQLFWREYFYQLSFKNPNFAQIKDNTQTFQIPWYSAAEKSDLFNKWENGLTGFPFIDASMRQLRQEGWIHHFCRNALSVFLTRGDLWISWEDGLRTFLKYQLDADWSVCAGTWNWISGGLPEESLPNETIICMFCPVRQGRAVDKDGTYIKKYVPELRHYPLQYLFAPWEAPLAVQEEANCVIGKDYPEPIVDHAQAFSENMRLLRKFFHIEEEEKFNAFANDKFVLKPANKKEYKEFVGYANNITDDD